MLEAGKMDKQKDLSKFDKGQIVKARWLGQNISKTFQFLLGVPSVQWSVSINSGPRKEQWRTGDRAMGGQGSWMHVGSEGWPVWLDPTDKLLLIKLLKRFMLILM